MRLCLFFCRSFRALAPVRCLHGLGRYVFYPSPLSIGNTYTAAYFSNLPNALLCRRWVNKYTTYYVLHFSLGIRVRVDKTLHKGRGGGEKVFRIFRLFRGRASRLRQIKKTKKNKKQRKILLSVSSIVVGSHGSYANNYCFAVQRVS